MSRVRLSLVAALGMAAIVSSCSEKSSSRSSDQSPVHEEEEQSDKPEEATKTTSSAKAATIDLPPAKSELPADAGKHDGNHLWSVSLGGETTDAGRTVATSSSGKAAIGGYFSTKAKLGAASLVAADPSDPKDPNEAEGFVATFDKAGAPQWTRQLGGKGAQVVSSVAFDKDENLIAVGWFGVELSLGEGTLTTAGADDIFVAKFAPDGRRLWAKRFGGINVDAADDVVVDPAGNIYVTGVFRADADFGGIKVKSTGLADIYLLKLNPAGEVIFVKGFGERYDDFGRSVTVDSQGNVLLFGEFSSTTSFGGPALDSAGNRDLFIAKLDPNGDHIWSKGMGTDLDEMGLGIATDPADSIVITGSFEDKMSFGGDTFRAKGRGDVFVAKYDRTGAHLWSKHFGGKDEDIGSSIATDSFGNIFITGWFRVSIDFGGGLLKSNGKKDAFVAKLSPKGAHLWSKNFGGKESDTGRSIAVGTDGSATTSGTFRYKVSLGGDELAYSQENGGLIPYADIFLARLRR